MYSKVTVPLDGSELAQRALPYARSFSFAFSIPIDLVRAVDGGAQDAMQYLAGVRDDLRAQGFAATATALSGQAGPALVDWAGADPDALIVISTHGRGGFARLALGSVTDRILHTVSNPMLVVRAGMQDADAVMRTVLVPLDGSKLAELSIAHAAALAAAWGAKVELLRVTTSAEAFRGRLADSARGRTAFGDPTEALADEFAQAEDEEADAYLDRMRRRLALDHPEARPVRTLHLQHEDPAQAIIERADAGGTLVVMTTHGRSGIGRMVLGSVTDQVLRHGHAPVLVVRERNEPGGIGPEVPVSRGFAAGTGNAGAQPA